MCLAVPGQIVELEGDQAVVDFQGNRMKVAMTLIPEARAQDWVLVHAGFAITLIDEQEAKITWSYLNEMSEQQRRGAIGEAGGADA
jgi:hydrogenase expression/formation protein HypC